MSVSQPDGGYEQPPRKVSFGWIGQAWTLFTKQSGAWVGAIALYLVVTLLLGAAIAVPSGYYAFMRSVFNATLRGGTAPAITPHEMLAHMLVFGLVFTAAISVLNGGLYRMALRQTRGEAVSATDLFSAFDMAVPLLLTGLTLAALNYLVSLLLPATGSWLSFLWQGLFMFTPLLIVDRRAGATQALADSFALLKKQWLLAALFYLVLTLVSVLGTLLCGFGVLATLPLLFLAVAVGYRTFIPSGAEAESAFPGYGQPEPGVWPPPPTAPPGT